MGFNIIVVVEIDWNAVKNNKEHKIAIWNHKAVKLSLVGIDPKQLT